MNDKACEYVRHNMPKLGLGTWQVNDRATIFKIVDVALTAGYRFIDSAQAYKNEEMIGDALDELLPKHKLSRSDIFITSKLSTSNQGKDLARKSIEESIRKLRTDYIDLFLIHWPGVAGKDGADPLNRKMRKESWEAMEQLFDEGKLRSIGVSNYNIEHLNELFQHARIRPAVNQCEFHPDYANTELLQFCQDNGVHFQAYSTFGTPDHRHKLLLQAYSTLGTPDHRHKLLLQAYSTFGTPDHRQKLFESDRIRQVADRHKSTVQKVLLAWAMKQGASVLPRSTNPQHVQDNFEALQVDLCDEDVEAMTNPDKKKYSWDPKTII